MPGPYRYREFRLMIVYRIERKRYLDAALSGLGAASANGFRWNSLGTRLVYTAESRALATLEVYVHLDLSEDLPTDRYYVTIEIPDDVKMVEIASHDLPEDWDAKPPGISTRVIGDEFVIGHEAAVLRVPSSIVPGEFNYLINPLHPAAAGIRVVKATFMTFDSRFKL